MIGNFCDVKEVPSNKFAESPLGKKAESSYFEKSTIRGDQPLAVICNCPDKNSKYTDESENSTWCPKENGKWTGERGDSIWYPDENFTPKKSNPEEKKWSEILEKHEINNINFKEGEPDFNCISKGTVEINNFSDDRSDNFDKADIELAKRHGCSPGEVEKWRKENGYTWHECKNMKTIQKVPSIIHNNISHRGGISEAKKGV